MPISYKIRYSACERAKKCEGHGWSEPKTRAVYDLDRVRVLKPKAPANLKLAYLLA